MNIEMKIDCYIPIKHGIECKKVEHIGEGYLHQSHDDSPYDVDGMSYCGRCHYVLGKTVNKNTVCNNCDTELPEGCGGIFKADGESCKYGV